SLVRSEMIVQLADGLVMEGPQRVRLAPEPLNRCRLIEQRVAHHLERDRRAGRVRYSLIADAHAAASHPSNDSVAMNILAAQTIVRGLPEALGQHKRQHDAKLGMR